MSEMLSLLEDVQRLRQGMQRAGVCWQAPQVQPCTLKVEAGWAATPAELLQRLRAFGGEGWIETTDALLIVPRGVDIAPAAFVLNAELADGTRSLHVRQVNAHWRLTWFEEIQGQTHLVHTHTLLGTEPAAARLHYRVYQPAPQAACATPAPLARLAGLE